MKRLLTSITRQGLFLLAAAWASPAVLLGQCPDNNTQVGATITPACPGTTNVPCVQGGQYALVNVITGNQYTFATCGAGFDTQISLYDTGGGLFGYNDDACGLQSSITWTASFTGPLRVLVDQYFCSNGTTCAPLAITCAPPPAPVIACGTTVYDPGGAAGNYANNTNYTVTYCPDDPGEVVSLNFSMFNTEATFDVVTIFNGPNTSAPVLGTFSGTGNPGTITSSAPGGCLTLRFTSDGSIPYAGWAALVNCGPPPPPPSGDCILVLTLNDSFGDGWGTSNVGVSINGGPYTYYTVTGSTFQTLIGVYIGQVIVLSYNNSGAFQGENSYTLGISGGGSYFNSGSPPAAGPNTFNMTVTCDPPPAPPQDCVGSTTICNGQAFNNNSSNTGNTIDLTAANRGCLSSGERQGTWYVFSPSAAGNIGFTINPVVATDYDFAVWGPYPPGSTPSTICPPASPPLRCSYAAPTGPTGCVTGAGDNSEGAGGNRWVNSFNVLVGQVYLLYVDNFSSNGQAFNLTWQLTGGASLDCTILPIELVNFNAQSISEGVALNWTTATEQNSDHFAVERSVDGEQFETIGILNAAGESEQQNSYNFLDRQPHHGLNHYRLRLVDTDGDMDHSGVRTVQVDMAGKDEVLLVPNPGTDHVQVLLPSNVQGSTFVLVDATGRTISQVRPQNARLEINTIALPKGLYGFRLLAPDGSVLDQGTWVRE